jgi:hypothetical protein
LLLHSEETQENNFPGLENWNSSLINEKAANVEAGRFSFKDGRLIFCLGG